VLLLARTSTRHGFTKQIRFSAVLHAVSPLLNHRVWDVLFVVPVAPFTPDEFEVMPLQLTPERL